MKWQPIETAPKDGTQVLLYNSDHGVRIGRFVDIEHREYGKVTYTNREWMWLDSARIMMRSMMMLEDLKDPTHWMPLPEPPMEVV